MLGQLRGMNPRRLLALGLAGAAVLIGVLLIVLWQVGLFDSAPPPATIESAVESVRQEQQQEQQSSAEQDTLETPQEQQAQQDRSQQQADQPVGQETASQSDADQQQDSDSGYGYSEQDYQQQEEQQDAGEEADDGQQQSAQDQAPQQQAQQESQAQDTQSDNQAEQEVMTLEPPDLSDLAGTWVLSSQGTSFVGYRIGEELANIGTATAVGRTGDIEVALEFDGAVITSVVITADLRTLQSDQSFRDGALRTRGLESDTYPFATFNLTEPIPIDVLPIGEETLSATVQGTLDLHGVTNPVTISLDGQYVDDLVVVVGSTEIALADYDIEPPTGFRVLSIEDVGIMEFQLVLERAP